MSSTSKRASRKPAPKPPVRLTDPRAIKALAHPARLAVIDEFFAGRKLTATECAEIAGLSASAMSYHLRALERWGIIRRSDASADGRERPWEAAGHGLRVESSEPRASAAVESAMMSRILERERGLVLDWLGRAESPGAEWAEFPAVTTVGAWLTAEEAAAATRELDAVIDRYRRRTPAEGPEGTIKVRLTFSVVPTDDPPPEPE
jgi:DNA-binding transcriptional ArsR family regulator